MSDVPVDTAGHGDFRLLVKSIGSADAVVIGTLRRLRRGSDAELAELLYRAPAELMRGLDRATGARLCEVLRETGIDVDLVPPTTIFEPGTGDYEVALVITEVNRLLDVVRETMRVLGVDMATAKRLVCANPAVLIGRISSATVEALRRRFEALGVTLDVSCSVRAQFDIAAESSDEITRRQLQQWLAQEGAAPALGPTGQLLAGGLNGAAAQRIWERLRGGDTKVRVLNRDFQRFDVRIESAPAGDDPRRASLIAWMVSAVGASERAATRALSRTPFVLADNVSGSDMVRLLNEVRDRGGCATGVLLALQTFALNIAPGGDRQAARIRIETIADVQPPLGFERGHATTLQGPFSKTQARWLQYELRRVGVGSVLVER